MRGRDAAITPAAPFAPEYSQKPTFMPHRAALQLSAASGAALHSALEAPPPKSSPGSIFVLRT